MTARGVQVYLPCSYDHVPAGAALQEVTSVPIAKRRAILPNETKCLQVIYLAGATDCGIGPAEIISIHNITHRKREGAGSRPTSTSHMRPRARGAKQLKGRVGTDADALCPHCRQALPTAHGGPPEATDAPAHTAAPQAADNQRCCLFCGDALPSHLARLHLKRLFCSNACRQKAYRLRKQDRGPEASPSEGW